MISKRMSKLSWMILCHLLTLQHASPIVSSDNSSSTGTCSISNQVTSNSTLLPPSSLTAMAPDSSTSSSGLSSTTDIQTQMMPMLIGSFSKLSTVLGDKTVDSKFEWPKILGDSKTFRPWYLVIMTQLSLSP